MLSENELLYTLALQRAKNLGDTSAKKLIYKTGSAEGVFREKKSNLLKIDGIGKFKLQALREELLLPKAEKELHYIREENIDVSYFQDANYPSKLKHCLDGPILFFKRGKIDFNNAKMISIVGTRMVTSYGISICEKLIEDLAPLNPLIVSGYAYGVDITVHKMAIKKGLQNIACLAHGLQMIYPRSHHKYNAQVEENGGFVTEFWSDDSFNRANFLRRNRIIAGLSEATVVIESAERGGSLVTAALANSYNRDVFAVPARVTDIKSKGCNNLIKTNQAHMLCSAADLIYMLGWKLENAVNPPQQTKLFVELGTNEQQLWDYLNLKENVHLDDISLGCGMPTFKVASLLLQMELKGVVRPLPGKLFTLM